MKNLGLIIVIISIFLSAFVFSSVDLLKEWKINPETAAWSCFVLAIVGTALSISYKSSKAGKIGTCLGGLECLLFLIILMSSSSPSREYPNSEATEPKPANPIEQGPTPPEN